MADLFPSELAVINLGLPAFGQDIARQGAAVSSPEWRPPAGGDPATVAALTRMLAWPEAKRQRVAEANREAGKRLVAAQPVAVAVGRALDLVPGMTRKHVLHAGPPLTWERMCGPQRGAVIGALIYEGWLRMKPRRPNWRPRERSNSPPATTTIRWAPWRAWFLHLCRSSS